MSKKQETQIEEVFEHYKQSSLPLEQDELVALLKEIQEVLGCIPAYLQERIAKELQVGVPVTDRIISLYPSLTKASYQNRIRVCNGKACVTGAGLLEAIKKEFGIEPGEVSKDGAFLLEKSCCMKRCKKAGNMRVNQDDYHGVTKESVFGILKTYQK